MVFTRRLPWVPCAVPAVAAAGHLSEVGVEEQQPPCQVPISKARRWLLPQTGRPRGAAWTPRTKLRPACVAVPWEGHSSRVTPPAQRSRVDGPHLPPPQTTSFCSQCFSERAPLQN